MNDENTLHYEGKVYKAEEACIHRDIICQGCHFHFDLDACSSSNLLVPCTALDRLDEREIIWKLDSEA